MKVKIAKLAPEEQENFKRQVQEVQRNNKNISLTWQLYMMFLSQGERAEIAIEKSRDAVEVWKEFEENNKLEYPDVEMLEVEITEKGVVEGIEAEG